MRKLSEEHPPGALGGSQVTVMTTKKSWSLFNFIVPILFGEMMFLELFCDVLHNDLSALYRGYVYKHIEMSDAEKRAYGWLSFMASTSGCQIGFVCRKFLWACSLRGQWRVSLGEYASRYRRDQHVGCVAYESRIHTTHAWNPPKVERSKFHRNISKGVHLGTKGNWL